MQLQCIKHVRLYIIKFLFFCRLSQLAGAKLTEGNPNIADLSDKNRPTNLAEHFSELYDNEWTDALEEMTDTESKSEEEGIKILFDIVKVMISGLDVLVYNLNKYINMKILNNTGNDIFINRGFQIHVF